MLLLLSSTDTEGVIVSADLLLDDITTGAAVSVTDQVERRAPVRSYIWVHDVDGNQAGVIA